MKINNINYTSNNFINFFNYKNSDKKILILAFTILFVPLIFISLYSFIKRIDKKQILGSKFISIFAKKIIFKNKSRPETKRKANTSITLKRIDDSQIKNKNNLSKIVTKKQKESQLTMPPYDSDEWTCLSESEKIPTALDVSGDVWFNESQLWYYFIHLSKIYPHLQLHPGALVYKTIETSKEDCLVLSVLSAILQQHKQIKRTQEKTILAYPLMLAPADGKQLNHWTLIVVDLKKRTLEFYDSLKNYGNHARLTKELKDIAENLTRKISSRKPFRVICKIQKGLQTDSYECAPWTLYFLEQRLKNDAVNFNKLDPRKAKKMIAKFRKHVLATIVQSPDNKMYCYREKFCPKESFNFH